jgi:hypothetical protein
LPESARHVGQGSAPLRKASSDRSPDCLYVEIKYGAHDAEGEEVPGVGQHPVPCLVSIARAGDSDPAPRASEALEILEDIRQDGQAEAAQPAVCPGVLLLHGLEAGGGKWEKIGRHTRPSPFSEWPGGKETRRE